MVYTLARLLTLARQHTIRNGTLPQRLVLAR